ncbi:CARDB domain-containing protein, partial [Halorubrum sp. Atlit-26R]|uniref:CARDB domain-containing protein n=1 Tax=Halorubrum sp. Atlit-26R TaxID=2282128 RepID=UPI000F1CB8E3
VRNDGELSGTQDIRFEAGGDVLATNESVQLDAGESIEQNFTVNASELDTGSQQIGIFTENTSRTTTLTVSEPEPADIQVDIDEVSGDVQQGAPVDVNVTVENVGDLEAENESIALDLSVEGEQVALDSADVTLAGGESTSLTLSDTVDPLPRAGTFDGTVEVTAGDATDTAATRVDFGSIQSGVDAASEGDTVLVAGGVYAERVVVDTDDVALQSVRRAVVFPRVGDEAIAIRGDGVTVSGFSLPAAPTGSDSGTAIRVTGDDATIRGVQITNWGTGV